MPQMATKPIPEKIGARREVELSQRGLERHPITYSELAESLVQNAQALSVLH